MATSRGLNWLPRWGKIAKVLRVFRTLRFFTELRLMMDCPLEILVNFLHRDFLQHRFDTPFESMVLKKHGVPSKVKLLGFGT